MYLSWLHTYHAAEERLRCNYVIVYTTLSMLHLYGHPSLMYYILTQMGSEDGV
jgi:hypothetical protein